MTIFNFYKQNHRSSSFPAGNNLPKYISGRSSSEDSCLFCGFYAWKEEEICMDCHRLVADDVYTYASMHTASFDDGSALHSALVIRRGMTLRNVSYKYL